MVTLQINKDCVWHSVMMLSYKNVHYMGTLRSQLSDTLGIPACMAFCDSLCSRKSFRTDIHYIGSKLLPHSNYHPSITAQYIPYKLVNVYSVNVAPYHNSQISLSIFHTNTASNLKRWSSWNNKFAGPAFIEWHHNITLCFINGVAFV